MISYTVRLKPRAERELDRLPIAVARRIWEKLLAHCEIHLSRTVIEEARLGVVTAIMVGFGRAISEVGAVLIVGGNIRGSTRVLTTAIVLETSRGNFDEAIALGGILLVIGLAIFLFLYRVQQRGHR